ncbi:MAG TPA: thiamine pyrophosphate-dependent enzyme [Pirellulales bacterium]|nr:thiamine pyrophosphate-dependent enzyme [Pirellulales bacterium]
MSDQVGMSLISALEALADWRTDQIVVTTMGAAREWPKLSRHACDFHYLPSAMGHAPMLGLGLALARPQQEVVVLNGDGCMLMSLGCLVTIATSGAENLTLVVIENGIYEVTGGQATAGARSPPVDFAALARAAGFTSVATFETLERWRHEVATTLVLPGPRCVVLRVAPVGAEYHLPTMPPVAERLRAFQEALAS